MTGYAERCEAEIGLIHLQASLNAFAWHKPNRMPKLDALLKGRGAGKGGAGGDVPTREEGVVNARRWIALLGGARAAARRPARSARGGRRNPSTPD